MGKDLDPSKVRAARAAADLVESGMVVGLGTGSTAALMVQRLGERREQDGLKIIGVPTSVATAESIAARPDSTPPVAVVERMFEDSIWPVPSTSPENLCG